MTDQPVEQTPDLEEVPESELAIHTPPAETEGTEGLVSTVVPADPDPRQEA